TPPGGLHPAAEVPTGAIVLVVTPEGSGTGVVLGPQRQVLTSWHLIDGHSSVLIVRRGSDGLPDLGNAQRAKVERFNVFSDLALLTPPLGFGGDYLELAAATTLPKTGTQVHVLSHDRRQLWRHDLAIIVQLKSEHSWFSGNNMIHRAPALRLQMATPPALDGAPILNADYQLIGLQVDNGRGAVTAVAPSAIHAFLGAASPGAKASR
ncbi:MAG: hypothetical protein ACI8PT_003880, partial [Gammaproteobacteria bacterium]